MQGLPWGELFCNRRAEVFKSDGALGKSISIAVASGQAFKERNEFALWIRSKESKTCQRSIRGKENCRFIFSSLLSPPELLPGPLQDLSGRVGGDSQIKKLRTQRKGQPVQASLRVVAGYPQPQCPSVTPVTMRQ